MYKRILAPLDGSRLSECSLDHVKAIATGCKATEVVLLTVVEETSSFGELWSEPMAEVAKQQEKWAKETRQKAENYLSNVASSLRRDGVAVQTVVVPSEIPHGAVHGILDYVRDNKVDLIVMSTHGRSGISRWAFGSVTEKVIRSAKVPVLTIPPVGCRVS